MSIIRPGSISCIGVAVADSPTGKFKDYGPVVEFGKEAIDAFILEDKGKLYISWKAYGLDNQPIELLACKLTDDGLRLDGKPFSLLRDDERQGMEEAVAARRAITPYPWLARKSWKVLTRNTKETRSCTEARRFSPSVTERLRQHRTDACITYATLTSREAASTKVANLTCKR